MFIKANNNDVAFSRIYYFYEGRLQLICYIKVKVSAWFAE